MMKKILLIGTEWSCISA